MAKDVIPFKDNVTEEEIRALDKELPTDIHLIEFVRGQELFLDAVRAYRKVDIFDLYHDILSKEVQEGTITNFEIRSITNGYGSIKPKLYQTPKNV